MADEVVGWARGLAMDLLAGPLPRRWRHVEGVAARAESLRPVLGEDTELLVAAGWVHDIGYSPTLVDTGLHALDGARHLRAEGADDRLCRLVAHHSCALCEATERGVAEVLSAEFEPETRELADAMIYADMTTSPDGAVIDLEARLADIHSRYGPEHLVSRSIRRATPELRAAVRRVKDRLAAADVGQPM